jgi:hypothetical protein
VFTVVHDLADHGLGVSNLYQIKTGVFRRADGLGQAYNADLLPVCANESYLVRLDLIINGRTLAFGISLNRFFLPFFVIPRGFPQYKLLSGGIL